MNRPAHQVQGALRAPAAKGKEGGLLDAEVVRGWNLGKPKHPTGACRIDLTIDIGDVGLDTAPPFPSPPPAAPPAETSNELPEPTATAAPVTA